MIDSNLLLRLSDTPRETMSLSTLGIATFPYQIVAPCNGGTTENFLAAARLYDGNRKGVRYRSSTTRKTLEVWQ